MQNIIKMKRLGVLFLYCVTQFAISLPFSYGWWDEGHMLISTIARNQLTEEETRKIEGVLKQWDSSYKGLSRIEYASVWADHIKCHALAEECQGLPFLDDLKVFSNWHYVDNPIIAEGFKPNCLISHSPLPESGGAYILKTFWSTVRKAYKSNDPTKLPIGSNFAWNMIIRMFLHIFGDLHQPLHTVTGYSKHLPHGDEGGNYIHLGDLFYGMTFHAFFDSVANTYTASWPEMELSTLHEKAANITKVYEKKFKNATEFDPEKFNINDIVDEGVAAAKGFYEAINFANYSSHDHLVLDQKFIDAAIQYSEGHFYLAGIRMGQGLKYIAAALPDTKPNELAMSSTFAIMFLICVSLLFVASLFWLMRGFWKQYMFKNGDQHESVELVANELRH